MEVPISFNTCARVSAGAGVGSFGIPFLVVKERGSNPAPTRSLRGLPGTIGPCPGQLVTDGSRTVSAPRYGSRGGSTF